MNVRIYISVADTVEQAKSNLIFAFSSELNKYFKERSYGVDIENLEIGLLMVYEREGYDKWYKPKKMRYTKFKKGISKLTGEEIVIENTLKYELKLSDLQISRFVGGDDDTSRAILETEILSSLRNLNVLPKEVHDFEIEKFREDLREFVNSRMH